MLKMVQDPLSPVVGLLEGYIIAFRTGIPRAEIWQKIE